MQIDELDFAASAASGGAALIFGNERRGVSRSFIERADRSFYLPMCGLTQSFNISVAVAMSLYHAVASGAFVSIASLSWGDRLWVHGPFVR